MNTYIYTQYIIIYIYLVLYPPWVTHIRSVKIKVRTCINTTSGRGQGEALSTLEYCLYNCTRKNIKDKAISKENSLISDLFKKKLSIFLFVTFWFELVYPLCTFLHRVNIYLIKNRWGRGTETHFYYIINWKTWGTLGIPILTSEWFFCLWKQSLKEINTTGAWGTVKLLGTFIRLRTCCAHMKENRSFGEIISLLTALDLIKWLVQIKLLLTCASISE